MTRKWYENPRQRQGPTLADRAARALDTGTGSSSRDSAHILDTSVTVTPSEIKLAKAFVSRYLKKVPRRKRLSKDEIYDALGLNGRPIRARHKQH